MGVPLRKKRQSGDSPQLRGTLLGDGPLRLSDKALWKAFVTRFTHVRVRHCCQGRGFLLGGAWLDPFVIRSQSRSELALVAQCLSEASDMAARSLLMPA